MKLIRNQTEDGSCKYGLLLLEKMDTTERQDVVECVPDDHVTIAGEHILLGNESPGDQFFVLKYKDKFTAPALRAYGHAVIAEAESLADHADTSWDNPHCEEAKAERAQARELLEYAAQIIEEANKAESIGCKIPD